MKWPYLKCQKRRPFTLFCMIFSFIWTLSNGRKLNFKMITIPLLRMYNPPEMILCKGRCKKKPYLFGTLSQTSDPTHPPRTFGTPLSEKKVKFILLFRLFRAFYFFEKMRNFLDKIPKFQNLWGLKASWNSQIWPPHLCITCFRTFLDVCSKNNWMGEN